jgi:hypothetical protein
MIFHINDIVSHLGKRNGESMFLSKKNSKNLIRMTKKNYVWLHSEKKN